MKQRIYPMILFFLLIAIFPLPLKADFHWGVYWFRYLGCGFDFSNNCASSNCENEWDLYWSWPDMEQPWIEGHFIDLGQVPFMSLWEAPDTTYSWKHEIITHNHVYVIKTRENYYAKFIIFDNYNYAMLWVLQDDGTRNLNWEGTATKVMEEKNMMSKISDKYKILQNYPNPFNSQTTITLNIPHGLHLVELNIFNVMGQPVVNFVKDNISGGIYKYLWDGKDKYGFDVPSGLYLIKLDMDNSNYGLLRSLLIR